MIKANSWIKIWFIIISLILFIGAFNYIVDPDGFNRKVEIEKFNKIKAKNNVSSKTIKFKMPLLTQGDWDNLMMGTSRIGVLDNNVVSKHLGGKTFNMEQPASVIPVQFDSFMYAVHYNNIKNVVYAIDFMSLNSNRRLNDDYIMYGDKLRAFDPFYTYDIYFNLKTLKRSLKLILANYKGSITPSPTYLSDGRRVYQNYIYSYKNGTFDIQKKIDGTIRVWFREKNGYYENYKYSAEYMKEFEKIVNYCKNNNINLYVYISPMYQDFFHALGKSGLQDEFEHFKKELVKVTNFIDFTGINKITTNTDYFWDSAHLKVENTDLIMDDVLVNKKSSLKFGTFINKHNIQLHIKNQKLEYKDINLTAILKKQ